MAYHSCACFDAGLEDLPFPISPALLDSALVSPNLVETLNNAEQFMVIRDYRTAAALFTAAIRQLGDPAFPGLVVNILCKRAECLLRMNYVQYVLRDCRAAESKIGGENEYIAFLWLRALELQGEVQAAFVQAIIFKALDPEMERDKDAVYRLKAKVMGLCGQRCVSNAHELKWIEMQ
ncbi:hypothetical protein OS493_023630 [Desmophyllum pertusum]|uniref:Uncharacterized protein n=1 Tax=Desmophyllum pertusum TaxID=174260 RepID=A0A9X0CWR0_9CNID|nr:hypothetical protein OS493_023630 [Desmophyllum pertusum]